MGAPDPSSDGSDPYKKYGYRLPDKFPFPIDSDELFKKRFFIPEATFSAMVWIFICLCFIYSNQRAPTLQKQQANVLIFELQAQAVPVTETSPNLGPASAVAKA